MRGGSLCWPLPSKAPSAHAQPRPAHTHAHLQYGALYCTNHPVAVHPHRPVHHGRLPGGTPRHLPPPQQHLLSGRQELEGGEGEVCARTHACRWPPPLPPLPRNAGRGSREARGGCANPGTAGSVARHAPGHPAGTTPLPAPAPAAAPPGQRPAAMQRTPSAGGTSCTHTCTRALRWVGGAWCRGGPRRQEGDLLHACVCACMLRWGLHGAGWGGSQPVLTAPTSRASAPLSRGPVPHCVRTVPVTQDAAPAGCQESSLPLPALKCPTRDVNNPRTSVSTTLESSAVTYTCTPPPPGPLALPAPYL